MENHLDRYFTTGEFAKLCNVTKHTLFHYDQIGLFPPELRLPNGYRYYSASQLDVFDVISNLRELDMPLWEIKQYLDNRSPQAFIELLQKESVLIEEKIKRLKNRKELAKKRAAFTASVLKIDTSVLSVVETGPAYLVATKIHSSNEKRWAQDVSRHMQYCEKCGIQNQYPLGALQELSKVRSGLCEGYSFIYTLLDQPPKHIPYLTKVKGRYLCGYHSGSYDTIGQAYEKLLAYEKSHKLSLCGDFYEDVLLDSLSASCYDSYIFRITIQVE